MSSSLFITFTTFLTLLLVAEGWEEREELVLDRCSTNREHSTVDEHDVNVLRRVGGCCEQGGTSSTGPSAYAAPEGRSSRYASDIPVAGQQVDGEGRDQSEPVAPGRVVQGRYGLDDAPPPIRFHQITLQDGLSQGHIYDILQDQRGFLWFATESGLNRYDGHTFEVYAPVPFDSASIADGTVNGVYEDGAGHIWVATRFGGLNRLDPLTGTFTRFQHDPHDPKSLGPGSVTTAFEDHRGALWVGTESGLSRMDPVRRGRFTHYRHEPDDPFSLSNNLVRSIGADEAGMLWIATANGLNRMDLDQPGRFERYLHGPGSPDEVSPAPGRSLHRQYAPPGPPGVRWIGSDDGLIRFDTRDGSIERVYPNPGRQPGGNVVITVSPDPAAPGVLWVPTQHGGVARFDPATATFTRYRSDPENPHGLVAHAGSFVYTDRSGMVWVGSAGGGVNKFDPAAIEVVHYGAPTSGGTGLRNSNVWGLGVTRDGAIWAGTDESYLHRIDPSTGAVGVWQADLQAPTDPDRPACSVYDFAENPDGTLWIGTGCSLDRYDPATGRFTHFRHDPADPSRISNHDINYLFHDSEGTLWAGTADGLNRFDAASGTFTRYFHGRPDSTTSGWIGAILEDHSGRLWVGTEEGVCRLDRATGRFTHYHHDPRDPATLTNGRFAWIHERASEPGVLWMASIDGGGLDRLDTRTGEVTHYTTATSGLLDNTVYSILEDDKGRLWLSTNHGIARFDPDAPSPRGTFRSFGLESGLQGLEFNQHAVAQDAEGRLYFGGVHGITAFQPSAMEGNTVPPRVALVDIEVANESLSVGRGSPLQQPLAETDEIRLAYDQTPVTFEFVALHFKNPSRNRYRYRLDGYDGGWVEAGTRREATYTNVPPGTYRFRVRAANADGVWNERDTSVGLVIVPPWWRTWWAYLSYALLLVGSVVTAFYVQRRRLERRQRYLEEAVAERTRQVHDQNEQLAEQAARLRELDDARSRFFANISHEFRTPLTLILGPLNDLLDDDALPDSVRTSYRMMLRNGNRLLRLVNQLLDLARLDAGQMKLHVHVSDLVAFTHRTVRDFQPLAERKQIALAFQADPAHCKVSFDPEQIEKVLANLLSNAIKFTPEGGAVTVSLALAGEHAEIAVADNGPGIPKAEQARLFDRFQQLAAPSTRAHEGTGIGLALARELAELHGGRVGVESTVGEGSTFFVRLPIHEAADRFRAEADETSLRAPLPARSDPLASNGSWLIEWNGAHVEHWEIQNAEGQHSDTEPEPDRPAVLVVDDHADVRAYVRSILSSDYSVLEAADGEAGLQTAREHLPDLIVADVMMPQMNGFDLGRALQKDPLTEGIPLLLLTARATAEDEVAGLDLGADAYVTKPFSAAVLTARVRGLIAKRYRLRELLREGQVPFEDESTLRQELSGDGAAKPAASPSIDSPFLEEVQAAVRDGMCDPDFSVDDLAEAVALSRSQLYRRLKAEADTSPSALIREMRLSYARTLLRDQEATVSEIAYAVGFNSLSYFSRCFREQYDISPSSIRSDASA